MSDLPIFMSPAKAARYLLGEKGSWVKTSAVSRGVVRDAFKEEDGTPVLDSFGLDEKVSPVEYRTLVEEVVKPVVLDGGADKPALEDFENFHTFYNCNADTCRASLFNLFELAGVPKSPTEVPLEDRDRVVKEVAARAVDRTVLRLNEGSTGLSESWAYSALRASFEKKGQFIYGDVAAYLLQQGAVLFDDERDNSPQSVKLLMMRLQRVMAEKMVAAPRKKLLRNWVRAKRNTKAWAANPADFEKIVQECIDLGHKEVELQKLDAAKEAERLAAMQSRKPADTVLTDAGGSTTAASSDEEEDGAQEAS